MKQTILCVLIAWVSLVAKGQADNPDCKGAEPAYLDRMKGFYLKSCNSSEYKEHEFFYRGNDGKSVRLKKAGEFRRLLYEKDKNDLRKVSGDQIRLNYANAVQKIKGEGLSVNNTFFRFPAGGNEVYMAVENAVDSDDRGYDIYIVEVKSMKQEIEFSLQEGIDKDGKVALYGILFDLGKSDIKAESTQTLTSITAYLNANPTVKIYIVGHTDNTGAFANNMVLSKARAESIKAYLVATGKISADRLVSEGVASLCPVSTNATDEGRKLNRRVEIVKQ
ncbi:MAG: OmpA family protein [Bacteroidales bacterium]